MRIAPDTQSGYTRTFLRRVALLTLGGGLTLSAPMSCAEGGGQRESDSDQRNSVNLKEGSQVLGKGGAGSGQQGQAVAEAEASWTIVLAAFRGEMAGGHRAVAEMRLPNIQAVKGLEEAFRHDARTGVICGAWAIR
jgi:hypothetical protein